MEIKVDILAFDYAFIENIHADHKNDMTNKQIQEAYGFGSNVVGIYINTFKVVSQHYLNEISKTALNKLDLEKELETKNTLLESFTDSNILKTENENMRLILKVSSLESSVLRAEDKRDLLSETVFELKREMEAVPYWVYNLFSRLKND